jgi:hypothetical protein
MVLEGNTIRGISSIFPNKAHGILAGKPLLQAKHLEALSQSC